MQASHTGRKPAAIVKCRWTAAIVDLDSDGEIDTYICCISGNKSAPGKLARRTKMFPGGTTQLESSFPIVMITSQVRRAYSGWVF